MSENKGNIENTNFKIEIDEPNKDSESLINQTATSQQKVKSIEKETNYLKQNISAQNSPFSEPNSNNNQNKNNSNLDNKASISNPAQIPHKQISADSSNIGNDSPYASVYNANPNNYPQQNYNYYSQASGLQSYPANQQVYANSAVPVVNYQMPNFPQQQYNQKYYNYSQELTNPYPYHPQMQGVPQQNLALNSNYVIPNSTAQSPFYYNLPQGSQAGNNNSSSAALQRNLPIQMQMQNQNQFQIQAQQRNLNYIPSAFPPANLNHSHIQAPNAPFLIDNNQTNQTIQNPNISSESTREVIDVFENPLSHSKNIPISSLNQIGITTAQSYVYPQNQLQQQIQSSAIPVINDPNTNNKNQNFTLPGAQQAELYYSSHTPYIAPIYNQLQQHTSPSLSEPESYGNINPYIKFLYNGSIACFSGIIAKLMTLRINVLESIQSVENTEFPESYRRIQRNFGSSKALCAIFPFSFSLVLWEYSKKTIEFIFRYDAKKLNEKYKTNDKSTQY